MSYRLSIHKGHESLH